MMLAGIDEAGKGSVIGPLVVCGLKCKEEEVEKLRELGVRDSKKLQRKKRDAIAKSLIKLFEYELFVLNADELNRRMERETINEILKECYSEIIKKLNADVIYVDSFDVKPERLGRELEKITSKRVIAMHRGERKEIVAAASIIAKHWRDRIIKGLKKEYGDFGSGYPSDKKTVQWLRENLNKIENLDIVRKKWKTLKRINQKTLSDF